MLILPIEECVRNTETFEKLARLLPNTITIFITEWSNKAAGLVTASKYEFIGKEELEKIEAVLKNYDTAQPDNKKIYIATMPALEIRINGKSDTAIGEKQKELIALLADNNGLPASKKQIMQALWPGYEKEGCAVLRNIISKANKHFREKHGIAELIKREGESRYLDKREYESDISEIFDKLEGIDRYNGKYLEGYPWAKNTKKILDNLKRNLLCSP